MRVTSRHLYQAWDVFLIMTVTLAAVEIPVRSVLDLGGAMASMDWAVTSILLLDILVRFRRPVRLQGRLVSSPHQVVAHYTKGWFWVDMPAALPWPLLTGIPLLHFLQLLKLARVAVLLQQWRQGDIHSATV